MAQQQPPLTSLFTREQIHAQTVELARRLSSDYSDCSPVLIGVLKGSFMFLADLAKCINIDTSIDFIQVSSYGSETESSGSCTLLKDITLDLTGRDTIIVEDIVDTGITLRFLIDYLQSKNPRSLEVCSLLVKNGRTVHDIPVKYHGFTIENEFVVGYGLDYDERYRNLDAIYTMEMPNI
ncbi:MAG: hypoxanthine phosphoribosyltransferase [Deltaproteobacteria bacterium]|nr:hypoxanthine phosphoribosyltransferase [Deltaproteobacteria bacterium]